jgi:hypothetical protein
MRSIFGVDPVFYKKNNLPSQARVDYSQLQNPPFAKNINVRMDIDKHEIA